MEREREEEEEREKTKRRKQQKEEKEEKEENLSSCFSSSSMGTASTGTCASDIVSVESYYSSSNSPLTNAPRRASLGFAVTLGLRPSGSKRWRWRSSGARSSGSGSGGGLSGYLTRPLIQSYDTPPNGAGGGNGDGDGDTDGNGGDAYRGRYEDFYGLNSIARAERDFILEKESTVDRTCRCKWRVESGEYRYGEWRVQVW